MRVYSKSEFKWVKNSLWNKDNYILALVPDEDYSDMFWIKWPDGTQSNDFYNLTRAKDHSIRLTLQEFNNESSNSNE